MKRFERIVKKYLALLLIFLKLEFTFRINFLLGRLRSILQIIVLFYLWSTVFYSSSVSIGGYTRDKILTYVFGVLVLRSLVLSTKAIEIAGEIGRGDLSRYLLKPVSYFGEWFMKDLSTKLVNFVFVIAESIVLFWLLKPELYIPKNLIFLILFFLSLFLAIYLFYQLVFLNGLITFWAPQAGWPTYFIFIVIIAEFLSGAVFPLDIMPSVFQKLVYLSPFPYLIFFPLQVFIGKLTLWQVVQRILISSLWIVLISFLSDFLWKKGLKRYEALGR